MWNVGVDLGLENVKIICLTNKKDHPSLISYGLFAREHVELIRETLQHPNLKHANIRVSMQDSLVKTKKLELPPAPPEELDSMVQMAMSQQLPEPIEIYTLRYQAEQQTVLISEKKQIDEYLGELRQFGIIHPAILEPKANALAHAALYNHPAKVGGRYAIVDIGRSLALFSVISENGLVFSRNLSEASGSDLITQIGSDFKITTSTDFLALQNPEAKSAFIQWLYKVAIEIQNSIESYQIQFVDQKIEELLLTGGLSKTPGLLGYIGDTLKISTSYLKAFEKIDTSGFSTVNFENIEQNYATAVGLAL